MQQIVNGCFRHVGHHTVEIAEAAVVYSGHIVPPRPHAISGKKICVDAAASFQLKSLGSGFRNHDTSRIYGIGRQSSFNQIGCLEPHPGTISICLEHHSGKIIRCFQESRTSGHRGDFKMLAAGVSFQCTFNHRQQTAGTINRHDACIAAVGSPAHRHNAQLSLKAFNFFGNLFFESRGHGYGNHHNSHRKRHATDCHHYGRRTTRSVSRPQGKVTAEKRAEGVP